MNIQKWLNKNTNNLKNKRVVITGATGGLGKQLCFYLAYLNANITLAVRSESSANKLISEIKEKYPNANLEFIPLNLESFESVNNFISQIKKYNGIDVLINNAGIYNVPIKKLEHGYNNVFAVNFVYPYYIIKKLLPELEKKENSVCLAVSSIAHNYSKIDLNDIDFSTRKKASKIYGNSKRFLTYSLIELFKNQKVNLSIVHPGITLTNMTNHYPKLINPIVKIGIKLLFPSPQKATLNLVYGIFNPQKDCFWTGPKLFNIWGKPKIKKLKTATKQEQKQIFEFAEEIYCDLNKTKL